MFHSIVSKRESFTMSSSSNSLRRFVILTLASIALAAVICCPAKVSWNFSEESAKIKLVLTGIGPGFSKVSGCVNAGDKATRRAGETATRPAEHPSTREKGRGFPSIAAQPFDHLANGLCHLRKKNAFAMCSTRKRHPA